MASPLTASSMTLTTRQSLTRPKSLRHPTKLLNQEKRHDAAAIGPGHIGRPQRIARYADISPSSVVPHRAGVYQAIHTAAWRRGGRLRKPLQTHWLRACALVVPH